MAYDGIDYGLGLSNVDKDTGIRYGVISANTVGQAWYDAAEPEYGNPHCPKCGNETCASDSDSLPQDAEWMDGKDQACADCQETFWNDECFPDEAQGYSFEDSEYTLTDCLDNDIFVLKSPYYTYAQFCSPCVPGAGNLDTPMDGEDGAKCYALGHEWFWDTDEKRAPYRVFRVSDDAEIISEEVEVICESCKGSGRRTAEEYMNLDPANHGFVGDNGERLKVGDTFQCNLCNGTGKRMEEQTREITKEQGQ